MMKKGDEESVMLSDDEEMMQAGQSFHLALFTIFIIDPLYWSTYF